MIRWTLLAGALALPACGGDGGSESELPTTPPTNVTMVTEGGFDSPMDAVSSPDGSTFYFSAHLPSDSAIESSAAIFRVAAAGGDAEVLHAGLPLEDPTGLLVSCDGADLYVADASFRSGDQDPEESGEESLSAIYQIDLGSATLSALEVSGIGEAASLAIGPDCETIYVTGFTEAGAAALFSVASTGGAATIIKEGSPLVSPSGVHVDTDSVAWVIDQLPNNMLGGALFAISPDGTTTEVVSGLALSEPAGVSLVAGGGTAVIATTNEEGAGSLLAVDIESGETTSIESTMAGPSGLKTARAAGIFAVADSDGDAIYRAE